MNSAPSQSSEAVSPGITREVRVGKHGIACVGYDDKTRVGPPTYRVADIGLVGVPRLSADQVSLVRRIEKSEPTAALRFGFVTIEGRGTIFIVYRVEGPICSDAAPGYRVLNLDDAFYEAGENPFVLHALPGDAAPTPGPWMSAHT
jgi:hypothetical protein